MIKKTYALCYTIDIGLFLNKINLDLHKVM